jgi:hypothetical protein
MLRHQQCMSVHGPNESLGAACPVVAPLADMVRLTSASGRPNLPKRTGLWTMTLRAMTFKNPTPRRANITGLE